ncbi:hypothetical protein [Ralstonia insidiosa]|jgi:hypothetical protein|nr:hypothetical protein [Ralstonia insidiosa]MBA9940441.1 hypothetical protein [Ralstonia insidiosa]MBC9968948.1 hypothetical protein [Ralstonia insidiosa]MBX3905008.1 hypothetical protein [Ralstonia insidiosa]
MLFGRLVEWGAVASGAVEPDNFDAARERYEAICLELGVKRAPELRLAKKVTLLSKIVLGDWRSRDRFRVAAFQDLPTDEFFLHELAHWACLTYGGYRGYHGAPFLALLQLFYEFYWEGDIPDAIEATVREDWPKYIREEARVKAIADARAAVEAIKARLTWEDGANPSADFLARAVRREFPEQPAGRIDVLDRIVMSDLLKTQRDGLFTLMVWACLATLAFALAALELAPNAVTSGLALVTGLLTIATVATIAANDLSRRIGRWWAGLRGRLALGHR